MTQPEVRNTSAGGFTGREWVIRQIDEALEGFETIPARASEHGPVVLLVDGADDPRNYEDLAQFARWATIDSGRPS